MLIHLYLDLEGKPLEIIWKAKGLSTMWEEIFREMIKGYSEPQLNHLVQSIALIRYIRTKLWFIKICKNTIIFQYNLYLVHEKESQIKGVES